MRKLVTAVIFRKDGRFLLLKRKLNWKGWEFVKGEVKRESLRKAVMREIREETGLRKARIIHKIPIKIVYHHHKIRHHCVSTQVAFLVEYCGGKIKTSPEHSGYRWAGKEQALKLLTHHTHEAFLKYADRYLREMDKRRKKELIQRLSKKHITHLRFNGKTISLKYDGRKLKCRAVRKTVKNVGDWSKTRNIVYYDKNIDKLGVLPVLIHEVVERHVALAYKLGVNKEAHKIATAVEKEFIADKKWIKHQKIVSRAWAKANRRKVGKAKFY